jgi:Tfp pilus assembly protein PilF
MEPVGSWHPAPGADRLAGVPFPAESSNGTVVRDPGKATPTGAERYRVMRPVLLVAGVVALCAMVFGPALAGEYVWDDIWQVAENPSLVRADGIGTILRTDSCESAGQRGCVLYHPLALSTIWLQARVTGLSLVAFRLGNLVIHLLCALLLVGLLRRLRMGEGLVVAGVLIFVFHPSVTEPVMWVVGRQDSLAAVFSLGAVLAWPDGNARRPLLRAGAAGLLLLLGLFCKETAIVVLALLLARVLIDRVPWRRALPWLLAPLLGVVVTGLVRRGLAIPSTAGGMTIGGSTLVIYATIVWHYFTQLALLDNAPTFVGYRPLTLPAACAVYFVLAAVVAVQIRALRRDRAWARTTLFGTTWFLVALAPHAVSLSTFAVFANRYAYFPLVGLLVVAAALGERLRVRCGRRWRGLGTAVGILLVGAACVRTSEEARCWRDEVTLYGHRLDARDGHALLPYAKAILRKQGCSAAVPQLGRVVNVAPDLAEGWHNLAGCFLNLGRYDWAIVAASRDVALAPERSAAHYNLGAALAFAGQRVRGVAELEQALKLEPGNPLARDLLARLSNRQPADRAAATAPSPSR